MVTTKVIQKDKTGKIIECDIGAKASNVTQDAMHRFVSDVEKDTWNGKANKTVASSTQDGLLSATDKKKLDGVDEGANKYTHPTTQGNKHVPAGGSSGQILKWKADGEAQWGSEKTYSDASQSTSGLLSAADKKKLDGVAEGANKYTHPSTHPASIITQNATHRFVSDEEKDTWNAAKQGAIDAIKALMSNTQVNNAGKIPTSALVYAMNQTLTSLNNALKVTQGTATVNSQYITDGSCIYWKYGKVVSFRAAGMLSLTKLPKGTFAEVITGLPAAPVQNMAVTLDCLTEDQVYGVTTVFMNGAVSINKSREITGQYFAYISGTYVCS